MLARLANQVLEAFPGSFKEKVKAKCTGNPLRKQFLTAMDNARQRSENEVRILIFGGSQGAQILNETVPEAIAEFQRSGLATQTVP